MGDIGHNKGPSLDGGAGFRRVAWSRARSEMLPSLPLEVVRLRVKRAKRLGLPYKTYATIRAVSGRDIVAFLFSSNALDMRRGIDMPAPVCTRLAELEAQVARLGAIHLPIDLAAVRAQGHLDAVARAPSLSTPWRAAHEELRALARDGNAPADGVVVVAATALEREWATTGNFAGVVDRSALFESGR